MLVSVGHSDATARQVAQAADARRPDGHAPVQRPAPAAPPRAGRRRPGAYRSAAHQRPDRRSAPRGPQVCVLAFRAAPGRICVVTDAAACAGMPPGRYQLGGEPIELPPGDGEPPVRADGTLAGSALRMDAAVANMVAAGIGLAEAVCAATRIPADLIGRPDLGRIAPGAAADLAWLGDDLRTRPPGSAASWRTRGPADRTVRAERAASTCTSHADRDRRAARGAAGHDRRAAARGGRGGGARRAAPGRCCSSRGGPRTTPRSTAAT